MGVSLSSRKQSRSTFPGSDSSPSVLARFDSRSGNGLLGSGRYFRVKSSCQKTEIPIRQASYTLTLVSRTSSLPWDTVKTSILSAGHIRIAPSVSRSEFYTFGAAAYEATGNLAMVMKVMGHTDVRTSMRYQHPGLESIRATPSISEIYVTIHVTVN